MNVNQPKLADEKIHKVQPIAVEVREVRINACSRVNVRVLVDFRAVLSGSGCPGCEACSCRDELPEDQVHQRQQHSRRDGRDKSNDIQSPALTIRIFKNTLWTC